MNLAWQQFGACVDSGWPDQWYDFIDYPGPLLTSAVSRLRDTCHGCPVQPECLEWALHHEAYGMWGGLTPNERKKLRRDMGITLRDVA